VQKNSNVALEDLLIVPIQRICKYHLLLKDLRKNTIGGETKALDEALAIMERVTSHVNEEVRKHDNETKEK